MAARRGPPRSASRRTNAVHILASAGAGSGIADVAWLADNSPQGYATYLRPFSIAAGWLGPVTQVSSQYGDPAIWPGDTFGISLPSAENAPGAPAPVDLSWGSAVGGSQNSEIYAATVGP